MANIPTKPCQSIAFPVPQMPSIFSGSPGFTIAVPNPPLPPGTIPCCIFTLPASTPALPFPPLQGLGVLMAGLQIIIQAALAILPTIQLPSCPK